MIYIYILFFIIQISPSSVVFSSINRALVVPMGWIFAFIVIIQYFTYGFSSDSYAVVILTKTVP
jgi:hypothetical protein